MDMRVTCPTLAAPENGAVTGGNSYQDVVQFTCNHGYQLIGDSSRTCQADGTWTGADPACRDINECTPNGGRGPCGHTCRNTVGSFICSCNDGYTLNSDGWTCDDINDCTNNGGRGPCEHYCHNTVGSFLCSCNTGYALNSDGRTCDDIDDCSPNPCVTQASCTDVLSPGTGATCTCGTGYVGDGRKGGTGCTAPGMGATCTCGTGYVGDGLKRGTGCTDIDGCSVSPCVALASCADVPAPGTGATCSCPAGYDGNGRTDGTGCTDNDGCSPSPCVTQAHCTDVPAPGVGATCNCTDGYVGDGRKHGSGCTDIDGCSPNPCHPQARCTDIPAPGIGARCVFTEGFNHNKGNGSQGGTGSISDKHNQGDSANRTRIPTAATIGIGVVAALLFIGLVAAVAVIVVLKRKDGNARASNAVEDTTDDRDPGTRKGPTFDNRVYDEVSEGNNANRLHAISTGNCDSVYEYPDVRRNGDVEEGAYQSLDPNARIESEYQKLGNRAV
ncbi:FBN3 [Branchiostoma lanceolatum]|uniref:FBN3 protein n=1 Tax=Branchiostoma lanceolatum TaxID=7740 RepID=A0A8K0E5F0_BRALA|nr:FBN3 [Branchiostoma lanceolatum]